MVQTQGPRCPDAWATFYLQPSVNVEADGLPGGGSTRRPSVQPGDFLPGSPISSGGCEQRQRSIPRTAQPLPSWSPIPLTRGSRHPHPLPSSPFRGPVGSVQPGPVAREAGTTSVHPTKSRVGGPDTSTGWGACFLMKPKASCPTAGTRFPGSKSNTQAGWRGQGASGGGGKAGSWPSPGAAAGGQGSVSLLPKGPGMWGPWS